MKSDIWRLLEDPPARLTLTRNHRSNVLQKRHLGHLPPVEAVEEVVGAPLVGVGLQRGLHPRGPRDPDPLLFVVPPVPVEPGQTGENHIIVPERITRTQTDPDPHITPYQPIISFENTHNRFTVDQRSH